MKGLLALRALLHIKKHELFFGLQRFGIKNSPLANLPVFECDAAVGTGRGQLNANQTVSFLRAEGFTAMPLVSVLGAALE